MTVAIVANPQMRDIQEFTGDFERDHPDIKIRYVTLPENEARARITQDVATKAGQFDVVMIGTYEAPIWGRNGWLTDLTPYAERRSRLRRRRPHARRSARALSVGDKLYAVPFYGESSFLMYRKDLFKQAGLKMPERPTWTQVAEFARKLKTRRPRRHLPPRASGLGRAARAARHGHQHLRRALVRRGLERAAHLAGDHRRP